MLKTLLYIISISFQLAGALILVKRFNPMKVKEQVIEAVKQDRSKGGSQWHTYGSDGIQHTESKEIRQTKAEELYLNGLAFIYIAAGYILGIFGEIKKNRWIVLIFVITLAVIIMMISVLACRHFAEKSFPYNLEVKDE